MYIPKFFEETDPAVLKELVRTCPLATLVTTGHDGLNANHIPLLYSSEPAPYGSLRGHVARANPLWQEPGPVLAIFHGPDAYISPSWYATKQETSKVVPTWNYAVVHAYGELIAIDDADWLRQQLNDLTNQSEAVMPAPWAVSDAPSDYVEGLIKAIVGIEIVLTTVVGKVKASQNQPERNRLGVAESLRTRGEQEMADLVDSANRKHLHSQPPLN